MNWIDIGMYLTYALIAVTVIAILIFAVMRIAAHPQGAKSALVGIGGLVIVALLAFIFSTGEDATTVFQKLEVTESTSRKVGTGLVMLYIIMGATVLTILYAEITRLLK